MMNATDLACRAIELGYKPAPIHNDKFVRKGDTATITYIPSDWRADETTAIRTGLQASGLYLVRGDLDRHEDYQDPIARLADIKSTCGNDLYNRLVIVRSSSRTGIDFLFLTPMLLKSGTPLADHEGYNAGEIKCEGGLGRANLPSDSADWLQGSLETIPTLTKAETERLLSAFILPKPQARPAAAPTRTTPHTTTGAMDSIKRNIDLIDYLGYKVARWYQSGGALVHCGCGMHKHGDRSASLSIIQSRAGHLVAFGKTPACRFYSDSRGHDVISCMTICEGLSYADIAKKYGTALELKPTPAVARTSQEAATAPAANEPSKDALRKRNERKQRREAILGEIKAQLDADITLRPTARKLALAMLETDELQSRTNNATWAARFGVTPRSIQRAFSELIDHKYGDRVGGFSPMKAQAGYASAVWTWTRYRETLEESSHNQPTELTALELGSGMQENAQSLPIHDIENSAPQALSACEEEMTQPAGGAFYNPSLSILQPGHKYTAFSGLDLDRIPEHEKPYWFRKGLSDITMRDIPENEQAEQEEMVIEQPIKPKKRRKRSEVSRVDRYRLELVTMSDKQLEGELKKQQNILKKHKSAVWAKDVQEKIAAIEAEMIDPDRKKLAPIARATAPIISSSQALNASLGTMSAIGAIERLRNRKAGQESVYAQPA